MLRDIKFTVEAAPLSTNHVYRRGANRRIFMTNEGQAFKDEIGWEAKKAMIGEQPWEGPVIVALWLYMPSKRGDAHNSEKLIFDALQDIVYKNDRQIVAHVCLSFVDKERPRMEIYATNDVESFCFGRLKGGGFHMMG